MFPLSGTWARYHNTSHLFRISFKLTTKAEQLLATSMTADAACENVNFPLTLWRPLLINERYDSRRLTDKGRKCDSSSLCRFVETSLRFLFLLEIAILILR